MKQNQTLFVLNWFSNMSRISQKKNTLAVHAILQSSFSEHRLLTSLLLWFDETRVLYHNFYILAYRTLQLPSS